MKHKFVIYCLTLSIILISAYSYATDLKVNEITLSSTSWGRQTAFFNLTNTGEDYKFVVAISDVRFIEGEYESPRSDRKAYFIEPSSKKALTLPVIIPAGYGKIEINISFYDVVDTLDQVFESQQFFKKSFPVECKIPEELKSELVDDITLPKFVEDNELFDNYFSRALLILIHYGKTTEEIANLFQTDTDFIETIMKEYQETGLINIDSLSASLNFIAIDKRMAEAISPAIDSTVDNLFEVISGNLQGYDSSLVALVSEGKLSADKHNVLDLGTILYQKYPVILGLYLWDLLGREFVNDGKPFNIFEDSDPCNAVMGDFMYMMVGAENYIGDSYYYYLAQGSDNKVIYCGLGQHNIKCRPGYRELAKKNKTVHWEFDIKNPDKVYLYNEDKVREPLSILMDGTIEHIESLKKQMENIFSDSFYDTNNKGARYWCWDLVVTRLIKRFEDENILDKDSPRLYRLQETDF
ncbi:MAG TPA: hypothetical protein ENL22_03110 [candidate division Zixibacteria bacterium]|nr:hypothetical protein [candidate division Zixibacteria bacterium]